MSDRLRTLARGVVDRFGEHELLLRASAIAFQVLTAVVPFALFALGAAGFVGLEEVYGKELAPQIQESVSIPAYVLINDTLTDVLGRQHTFWATAGLALAVWQLSGAVRTAGATLDGIYGIEDERSWKERVPRSLWISAVVVACITATLVVSAVPPLLYGDLGFFLATLLWLVRIAVCAALLLLAVGVVVRHAPAERRPAHWVTGGAILSTVGWIAVSTAFAGYVTAIASYGSIYGVFTSVVVLLAWCYASALAFVAGIATDAELRASS